MVVALQPTVSRAETARLVVEDLARRLGLPASQVRVVHASDRTWPDATLGCGDRRSVREPAPVPGFRFTLEAGARRYIYHSDRSGRFRRCDPPSKPLGPVR